MSDNVTLTLTDDQAEALAVAARAWGDLLTGQQPPIPLKFADDPSAAAAESRLLLGLALKITAARELANRAGGSG